MKIFRTCKVLFASALFILTSCAYNKEMVVLEANEEKTGCIYATIKDIKNPIEADMAVYNQSVRVNSNQDIPLNRPGYFTKPEYEVTRAKADGSNRFIVPNLKPGLYAVNISSLQYQAPEYVNVRVAPDSVTLFNARLHKVHEIGAPKINPDGSWPGRNFIVFGSPILSFESLIILPNNDVTVCKCAK